MFTDWYGQQSCTAGRPSSHGLFKNQALDCKGASL